MCSSLQSATIALTLEACRQSLSCLLSFEIIRYFIPFRASALGKFLFASFLLNLAIVADFCCPCPGKEQDFSFHTVGTFPKFHLRRLVPTDGLDMMSRRQAQYKAGPDLVPVQ